MKFYRVELFDPEDTHCGYRWFTTKAGVAREQRRWTRVHPTGRDGGPEGGYVRVAPIDIPLKNHAFKRCLLNALRDYASHPDNG